VKIAASVLACDFGRLAEEIAAAEEGGAAWIHLDVMDGHFVPNLTIGPAIVEAARRATQLPLDVHLMIEEPDRYLEAFAGAGASEITVHQEVCPHLHRTLERIRELGPGAGVALNPATPLSTIEPVLPWLDLLLVMSVNPGFGGQSYIATSSDRLRRARALLEGVGSSAELEVDGGVDASNIASVAATGVSVIVAGSAVYHHPGGAQGGMAALEAALQG
jgi:ribulose-phosphate 3-epimerase